MALSRTDIGIYGKKEAGTPAFSTEEFTPPANSLLVVRVYLMRKEGESEMGQPTIEGGGLTWTARATTTTTLKASWSTKCVWFTAPVGGSPAKMKVTVDDANNLSIYEYAVSVIAFTGYNTSTPIGGMLGSGTTNIGDGEESRELSEAPASGDVTLVSIDCDSSKGPPAPSLETGWTSIHEKSSSGESGLAIAARSESSSKTVKVKDVYVGGGSFAKAGIGAIVIKAAEGGAPLTLASGGGVAGGSLAMNTPVALSLASGGGQAGGALALTTPVALSLASGGGSAGGALATTVRQLLSLAAGGGVAGGALALTAGSVSPAPLTLASGGGVAGGGLAMNTPVLLSLAAGGGTAGGALAMSTPVRPSLSSGGGEAGGALLLRAGALLGLASGGGEAGGALVVLTPLPSRPRRVPRPSKPPLALAVEIETADGYESRLDPSSRIAAKRPQGMTLGTQRGEGFGQAGFGVARRVMRDYADLNLLDRVRFVAMTDEVAYDGRNHDYSRTNDPYQQFAITAVGWYTTLAGNRRFSEIYMDRELGGWTGPSNARMAFLFGTTPPRRFEAQPDSGWQSAGATAPGILFTFTTYDTTSVETGEAWYWGGGVDLGELIYDLVVLAGGEDSAFGEVGYLLDDDLATSFDAGPTAHQVSSANQTVVASRAGRKFAGMHDLYTGTYTGTGNNVHLFANPRVIGRHGLTKRGAAPAEGFYVSDMLANIVGRFSPLTWDPTNVQTSYPVQQATFKGTKPDDAIKALNDYHLLETAVYEDKLFKYFQADLTTADWIVDSEERGVRFTPLQGDSIDSFANGVEVTYTDFYGRTYTLYPSDFAELRDPSETNPANQHGETLWTEFTVPYPCLQADALQIGRAYLAEYNRPKSPGVISVRGGYIMDAERHWQQGWKVRSSETVSLIRHPNDAPRLITQTNWDQDGKNLQISVDNGYQLLQAFLARMANARSAAGVS